MKLTQELKLKIYKSYQSGMSRIELSNHYNVHLSSVNYLVRLINYHGVGIIEKDKSINLSLADKLKLVNRVLTGESQNEVSIEAGLPSNGMLKTWLKNFKENGHSITKESKGKYKMKKPKIKNQKQLTREESLEAENEYLRAEVAYLKKLQAVVHQKERLKQKTK
jgi:hypothetical protein